MKEIFRSGPRQAFSLGKRGKPGVPGAREDVVAGKHLERPPHATPDARAASDSGVWTPLRKGELSEIRDPSDMEPRHRTPFGGMSPEKRKIMGSDLLNSLDENLKTLREIFHSPRNADLTVRQFKIGHKRGWTTAAIMYMNGLVDDKTVRRHLLEPLLRSSSTRSVDASIRALKDKVISQPRVRVLTKFAHVTAAIVEGETVLFVDGDNTALACDTRATEHRAITESPTEAVVRGPHTGFVENVRTNVLQVRVMLSSPDLVSEHYYVGARGHAPLAIVYLEGVANPKLVEEMRRRISSIRVDSLATAMDLSRILDSPRDPFPTCLVTERPDMVASMVEEGHIALIGNNPGVILVPATLWSMMHSSEDYYVHFIPASAIRLLRWLALFTTIYASSLYVAVVTFHPSMIPTELLFAMAASRESVPFPAVFEVLAMEVMFELIREAGIRIPAVVGPTIGIVGAVILGQAAVQAGIVSPILVVVVAVSGLGSFAIPNYNLSLYARLMKFVMIAAAGFLGLPGLTIVSVCLGIHILGLRSFGVPVTAPLLPHWPHSTDLVLRGPMSGMKLRPQHTRPLDAKRQAGGPSALVPGATESTDRKKADRG